MKTLKRKTAGSIRVFSCDSDADDVYVEMKCIESVELPAAFSPGSGAT